MRISVIGGGPGGYVAALKAAMLGADVTVIEKEAVGGTCLNRGCIPTKALLASSEVHQTVKEADKFGIIIDGEVKFDFKEIFARKDKVTKLLVDGIEYLFKEKGVNLVKGTGKLIDRKKIEVTKNDGSKEIVESDRIILATGSVSVCPGLFEYDGKRVITSDEVLKLEKLPETMIIVGGGVIGLEIGQFLNKFGTKVTIVEMAEHILPNEDEDVAKEILKSFKKEKIKVYAGDGIASIEFENDKVSASLQSGKIVEAEMMLVSVGRRAYTEGLGIEDIGIQMERGKVVVNEKMETNIEGIYAIGDIVDSPLLAHVASKEGMVAVENALGKDKKIDYRAVPRCIYTYPEVAGVGLTEASAKQKAIEYKVGKFNFRGLGKAHSIGKIDGFVKILADKKDRIIGASIVGPHATDLLAELTLAVNLQLTVEQVGDTIHAHPTLSEALMEALHDVHKQCVHSV